MCRKAAPSSTNRARAVRATRRPPEAVPRRRARAIRPDGRDARGRAHGEVSRRSAARDERAGGDVTRARARARDVLERRARRRFCLRRLPIERARARRGARGEGGWGCRASVQKIAGREEAGMA